MTMSVQAPFNGEAIRPRLAVVGSGLVGVVTAACFADRGHDVVAVDTDLTKLIMLRQGRVPFYEPGLDEMVGRNLRAGRLHFAEDTTAAARGADIVFDCVGTPSQRDGSADLTQVESVARTLAGCLASDTLIVEKSTVPVRTAERIERTIRLYAGSDCAVDVASNPEFMREGSAIEDFLRPDRIVIGAETPRARAILEALYADFGCPLVVTDVHTAELIKHAANAFLAMKISFINMIADLCEATAADVTLVSRGIGLDRRIGEAFLRAGVGYGGSCFPKDLRALTRLGEELDVDVQLLRTVQQMRVIAALLEEGARLRLYDPKAIPNMRQAFPEDDTGIRYAEDPYDAVQGADAMVVLTEWDEVRSIDLDRVRRIMRTPIVADGRNVFEPCAVQAAGLEYYGFGRPTRRALARGDLPLVRQASGVHGLA